MQKAALYTAGLIFTAGTIVHLVRLTVGLEISIGGISVPLWISYPGVVVAALLAVWMVVAAQRS
ncbi:MAG: hypothetical protein HQ503_16620 [Rhodospirillales bacterium]|nr:hypothetical protein [Rhodospirillales bacterium]